MTLQNRLLLISTLGAQSHFWESGFRQRDVKFFAEMLGNWIDVLIKPEVPLWHHTQIMRFLNDLTRQGRAKTTAQKRYHLTRIGLLDLMYELTQITGYAEIRHVLLVYYFLGAYRARMIELIGRRGSGYSKTVQIEINQLFDHKAFLSHHRLQVEKQIERLKGRVSEALAAAKLAEKLNRQNESLAHIIEQVALNHPYELEVQKPMAELFKEIEPEQRLWELTSGNRHRAEVLWQAELELLKAHNELLKNLQYRNNSRDLPD